jgi:hypothetical protein
MDSRWTDFAKLVQRSRDQVTPRTHPGRRVQTAIGCRPPQDKTVLKLVDGTIMGWGAAEFEDVCEAVKQAKASGQMLRLNAPNRDMLINPAHVVYVEREYDPPPG